MLPEYLPPRAAKQKTKKLITLSSKPIKIPRPEPMVPKRRLVPKPKPEPIEGGSSSDVASTVDHMTKDRRTLQRNIEELQKLNENDRNAYERLQMSTDYSNVTGQASRNLQRNVIMNLHMSVHLQELMEMEAKKIAILNALNETLAIYETFANIYINNENYGKLARMLKMLLTEELTEDDRLEPVDPLKIQCEYMCPTEVIQESANERNASWEDFLPDQPR
ncbi:hypothetical protein L596_018800 [Steinernema carpocapsae]|uniref:Uncharacterized protein n=1 Tax=Steinernema carpocapsae TaxID=34508 RepID=A0A4U5N6A0_STECR|nr:hypothetical protein L596_018800 [Steinernema carpocapsae]